MVILEVGRELGCSDGSFAELPDEVYFFHQSPRWVLDDVIEALFTTPVVTAEGVQRREARRAWVCRSGFVQILDNWDVP